MRWGKDSETQPIGSLMYRNLSQRRKRRRKWCCERTAFKQLIQWSVMPVCEAYAWPVNPTLKLESSVLILSGVLVLVLNGYLSSSSCQHSIHLFKYFGGPGWSRYCYGPGTGYTAGFTDLCSRASTCYSQLTILQPLPKHFLALYKV